MQNLKFRRKGTPELVEELAKLTKSDKSAILDVNISFSPLDERIFERLQEFRNLTRLNISHNGLRVVPAGVVSPMSKLEYLNLSYNLLQDLPEDSCDLSNLKELYLQGNMLRSLPYRIGDLRSLERLVLGDDLVGNPIVCVPDFLEHIQNLKEFSARSCEFQIVPPQIFYLSRLESIDLSCNQIESIPADWSKMTRLVNVDLSRNNIQELPDLKLPISIRMLNLSDNHIKIVPSGPYLHCIDLSLNDCCFDLLDIVVILNENKDDLKLQEMTLNALINCSLLNDLPASIREKLYKRSDQIGVCENCPFRFAYSNQNVIQPGIVNGHHRVPVRSAVCSRGCAFAMKINDNVLELDEDDLFDL